MLQDHLQQLLERDLSHRLQRPSSPQLLLGQTTNEPNIRQAPRSERGERRLQWLLIVFALDGELIPFDVRQQRFRLAQQLLKANRVPLQLDVAQVADI